VGFIFTELFYVGKYLVFLISWMINLRLKIYIMGNILKYENFFY
jgi:hypothetical protein